MIDELVQELRSYPAHYTAAHRAADALERIDFYNCRLEDDLVKLEAAAESLRKHVSKQQLDIVTLGQEVGRLREALDGVIRIADRDCPEFRAARAALGEDDK
jgi:predicted  nucleic acid-binding Zn-ribbon protein